MNCFKSLMFLAVLIIVPIHTFSQDSLSVNRYRPIAIFAEVGGGGHGFTLNVEKTFLELPRKWYLNARAGGGSYLVSRGRNRFMSVPIGVSAHHGTGKHHPEIALAFAYVAGTAYSSHNTDDFGRSFYLTPGVGYRYQKPGGAFFLKAQYVLLIKVKEFDHYWADTAGNKFHFGGICLGFTFNPGNRARYNP